MEDRTGLIEQVYAAFNRRDVAGALALMTDDVRWPRASEGGEATGKEEVRAYWTRQWKEFDPHVEPIAIDAEDDSRIRVGVHQLVRSLEGAVLSDSHVVHVFTVRDGRIAAMSLGGEAGSAAGPSDAFAHRA